MRSATGATSRTRSVVSAGKMNVAPAPHDHAFSVNSQSEHRFDEVMDERGFAGPRRRASCSQRRQAGLDRFPKPRLLPFVDALEQDRAKAHLLGDQLEQLAVIDLPAKQLTHPLSDRRAGRPGLARDGDAQGTSKPGMEFSTSRRFCLRSQRRHAPSTSSERIRSMTAHSLTRCPLHFRCSNSRAAGEFARTHGLFHERYSARMEVPRPPWRVSHQAASSARPSRRRVGASPGMAARRSRRSGPDANRVVTVARQSRGASARMTARQ